MPTDREIALDQENSALREQIAELERQLADHPPTVNLEQILIDSDKSNMSAVDVSRQTAKALVAIAMELRRRNDEIDRRANTKQAQTEGRIPFSGGGK